MYKVNETILYDTEGICNISEITDKNFGGKTQKFYILTPVNKNGMTIYVPIDNEKQTGKIRKVLSEEEIYSLIKTIPDEELIWIENDYERKETYKAIIQSGDRKELIKLIRTLELRKETLTKEGKKLHMSDELFMKNAERILYEEFSYVLNIKPEEVVPFIINRLEAENTH